MDFSTVEGERPLYQHAFVYDVNMKYLKWKDVPLETKTGMKKHVASYIEEQKENIETYTSIYIPGHQCNISKKCFLTRSNGIAVLYSHAILEYIRETNLLVDIPFTLTSDGRGWAINFVIKMNYYSASE